MISASVYYNIFDKFDIFLALGISESNLKQNVIHSNKKVIGMYGINTGSGFKYNHNPYTVQGNILCGAQVFSYNLKKYKGDIYKALIAYKGVSPLGGRQAKHVLFIAKKIIAKRRK